LKIDCDSGDRENEIRDNRYQSDLGEEKLELKIATGEKRTTDEFALSREYQNRRKP